MTRRPLSVRWGLLRLALLGATLTAAQAQDPAAAKALEEAQALLDRVDGQAAAGNTVQALASLAEARRLGAASTWLVVECWITEARVQSGVREVKLAEAALTKAMELTTVATGQTDWPQRPEILYRLGEVRLAANSPGGARDAWRELLARAPDSPQRLAAQRGLIDLDLRAGDLTAAAKGVDAYLAAQPWHVDCPALLEALGQALLAKGQPEAAATRFEQLRQAYPGTEAAWEARRPLVEALEAAKKYDAALALLDEVINVRPEMLSAAEALRLKAQILAEKGDLKAAAAALAPGIAKYPDSYVGQRLRLQQAGLLRDAKDLDGAVAALKQLDAGFTQPYWRVQTLRELFEAYRAKKDWDNAEDTADALAKLTGGSPMEAEALFNKAQVQHEAGRNRAAKTTLQRILTAFRGAPYVSLAEQLKNAWN